MELSLLSMIPVDPSNAPIEDPFDMMCSPGKHMADLFLDECTPHKRWFLIQRERAG